MPETPAYRVEQDKTGEGCKECGYGNLWDVIGPDGVAYSISWTEQSDAQDFADAMNQAYEEGQATGHKSLPASERSKLEEDYRRELRRDADIPEIFEVLQRQLTTRNLVKMAVVDIKRAKNGNYIHEYSGPMK